MNKAPITAIALRNALRDERIVRGSHVLPAADDLESLSTALNVLRLVVEGQHAWERTTANTEAVIRAVEELERSLPTLLEDWRPAAAWLEGTGLQYPKKVQDALEALQVSCGTARGVLHFLAAMSEVPLRVKDWRDAAPHLAREFQVCLARANPGVRISPHQDDGPVVRFLLYLLPLIFPADAAVRDLKAPRIARFLQRRGAGQQDAA